MCLVPIEERLVGIVANEQWHFRLTARAQKNTGIVGQYVSVDHRTKVPVGAEGAER